MSIYSNFITFFLLLSQVDRININLALYHKNCYGLKNKKRLLKLLEFLLMLLVKVD